MLKVQGRQVVLMGLVLALLVACRPTEPTPTPTPIPPTATVLIKGPTLPPSWTPGPAPSNTPKPQVAPTTAATIAGVQSLPPSWTPVSPVPPTRPPQPTALPSPTATITPAVSPTRSVKDGPPTPFVNFNYNAECAHFSPNPLNNPTAFQGASAVVGWTAVKGAEGYEFWLQNAGGVYVIKQDIKETSFTLPNKTLIQLGTYRWEVYPLQNQDRMCQSVVGEINVMAVPTGH